MLTSMTAYGRAQIATALGRFVAEIQSVNRKHLEITINLPKELLRFETDIRKYISQKVVRGSISVKLDAYFDAVTPLVVIPNLPLARQIKGAWDAIAKELGVAEQPFSLALLANEPALFQYSEELKDEERYRSDILKVIDAALQPFIAMRQHEGEVLQKDITMRLSNMRQWLSQIIVLVPGATERYRQKLMDRLEEVLPGSVDNEERILREIALYAERIDITEEITRFNSHLDQSEQLLRSQQQGIGKTFEFLLQELNREANTIASKSSDATVSRLVVDVKSTLEKIREQIQNVE